MFHRLFVILAIFIISSECFDKLTMSKDKNTRANMKHPISRRVLRYERSVGFEDFPMPSEMPLYIPTLDFAKVRPEIPSKTKHNSPYSDSDYLPELDF